MLTFNELLSEAQEPDLRTESQINEAQENIRTVIDRHFKSVQKITSKVLDDLGNSFGKHAVTTDGKWNFAYDRRGLGEVFRFSDSSSFMKNGTSFELIVQAKRGGSSNNLPVLTAVVNAFKESGENIDKAFEKLKEEAKTSTEFDVREYHESNKDKDKMNPYSMVKNVKPFTKELEHHQKLRRDDIIKMVINGQIEHIVVTQDLTDDYRYDGSGKTLDPIEFLKNDVFPFQKPYINVGVHGDKAVIHYSVHSNYSVELIPSKKVKVKFREVAQK